MISKNTVGIDDGVRNMLKACFKAKGVTLEVAASKAEENLVSGKAVFLAAVAKSGDKLTGGGSDGFEALKEWAKTL